jgi:hypothetical protein
LPTTLPVADHHVPRGTGCHDAWANKCTAFEYRVRTDKVTLQWSVARPNARRRKPQGKGGDTGDKANESGRACLGGRGIAPAGGLKAIRNRPVDDFREERRARGAAGRQARPDLTRVKSGKKAEITICLPLQRYPRPFPQPCSPSWFAIFHIRQWSCGIWA